MREVVLDTETTGLSPSNGDRVVEIGCVELVNHVPTGKTYQAYLNPEKLMDPSAEEVHGLTNDFLKDQPFFKDVADEFLNFISDSPLVIHNAEFDIGFLNSELDKAGLTKISINQAIDTLKIAREKFPGAQNSLDALCRRFDINNFDRELHGALLDSRILAEVYLELLGGKEPGLLLNHEEKKEKEDIVLKEVLKNKTSNDNSYGVNDEEKEKHKKLLSSMPKTPIWGKYKN